MKPLAKPKLHALTTLAIGAVLALSACSPASPGPSASATAPSSPETTASAPPSETTSPATTQATPGASATVGAVVAGFPKDLIPVMPGATVVSSSFEKSGNPATAALVGSIKAPAADVAAFYTKSLEAQGFKAVPGENVGGTLSKDFLRGDQDTVNVAVVETAGVSTFTVGANVAAGSIK